MKIIIATGMGQSKEGEFYNIFPSGWSSKGPFHVTTYYPWSLGCLSSLLKRDTDHEIKLIDGNYQGYTISKYAEVLLEEAPDVIVMESDSLTYSEDQEMLRRVKAGHNVTVIMCGAYPTANPTRALAECVDWVALGEFEFVVRDLIDSGFDPATPGVHPNGRAELVDPDSLPLPEDGDIKRRDYCRIYGMEYRQVEIIATRGCPYSCNFCVSRHVYDGKSNYRPRNPESVIAEIGYLRETIPGLEGIFFNDRSHTIRRSFNLALCDAIIAAGHQDLRYEALTNYAALDEELLTRMKEAGYYKMRIGLETLDFPDPEKAFVKRSGKRDHDKMFDVLETCKRLGIKVYGTLSVGTYGSTPESDRNTLRTIQHLYEEGYIQECQYSINTPMPGTPFYDVAVRDGYLATRDLNQYNGIRTATIQFPDYSTEEVEEVFGEFMAFGREMMDRNRDERGVRYSIYDEEWVAPVLAITPIAQQYR